MACDVSPVAMFSFATVATVAVAVATEATGSSIYSGNKVSRSFKLMYLWGLQACWITGRLFTKGWNSNLMAA